MKYRLLKKGEKILPTDEMLDCGNDNYNNDGKWVTIPKNSERKEASDPSYPAHTLFRRKI